MPMNKQEAKDEELVDTHTHIYVRTYTHVIKQEALCEELIGTI